ncbi:hypothetical protein [Sutterella sp.]|uniref:hypothetical protein n=1 Tax=Sutterella sp. TaxID=1981025 RepID=UPI0026DF04FF|nr:hypothetical protein [Sutterella sp.]MDO5531052.1 hypothetical protein [Sutterella sp.]
MRKDEEEGKLENTDAAGEREPLGVAVCVYPPRCHAMLVVAAGRARTYPEGSIARLLVVSEAIKEVRRLWPECFRR